jgi:5-aminolevulinate synthase
MGCGTHSTRAATSTCSCLISEYPTPTIEYGGRFVMLLTAANCYNNAPTDLQMTDYDDVFARRLEQLKESGSYRYFLDIDKSALNFPRFYYKDEHGEEKTAINWCSNDYLCMSVNPQVIESFGRVAAQSGAGSGGTRNISGTTIHHRELEQRLAALHKKEAALLFSGAYLANQTTLSTLGRILPQAVFLSDEKNHASLIEGMRSTGCEKIIFRHNDPAHLEELLKGLPADQPKILAFESVYSIHGTIAPLKEILSIAKKYSCLTYLDEVHAVGLYGQDGGGVTSQLGLQNEIDIVNGTLAKGFGVIGGYIAASRNIVDAIRSFGSGFIFTTSLPPAVCAAAIKSIDLVSNDHGLRKSFHANVARLREVLKQHGISYNQNPSHITPVQIGDSVTCKRMADRLLHEFGIYIQPVNYPTVKRGEECLRIIVTLKHTEEDILHLARSLRTVMDEEIKKRP